MVDNLSQYALDLIIAEEQGVDKETFNKLKDKLENYVAIATPPIAQAALNKLKDNPAIQTQIAENILGRLKKRAEGIDLPPPPPSADRFPF